MIETTLDRSDHAYISLNSEAEYRHQRQPAVTAGVDKCRAGRKGPVFTCSDWFG
jgi:hypothetical protein